MNCFRARSMNTDVMTAGLSPDEAVEVFQWFETIEKQFSRFLPGSELSRVNQNAGKETPVSERFIQLFYEALQYYEQTEGIFTPFLGFYMNRLGYGQTFEKIHAENLTTDNTEAPDHDPNEPITVDIDRRTVKVNLRNTLDFGGIAKGWSVQQIAGKMMLNSSAGLVDAGGDIMAWNTEDCKNPWLVGVAHPYSDQDSVAKLWLKGQAGIATSSIVKRHWKKLNRSFHHIIDPRTGLPAQSDCIQATVIGKELVPAEVYAKCLLILGSREGPVWLEKRRPELAYILLDKEGRLSASSNVTDYCHDVQVSQSVKLPYDQGGENQ